MLLLTYTQKVFYMYQSRLSLPSGSSRKSTQRARQRVLFNQTRTILLTFNSTTCYFSSFVPKSLKNMNFFSQKTPIIQQITLFWVVEVVSRVVGV